MKLKFTSPCIALYDLKKGWVHFEPGSKPNPQYYFLDVRLESGLRVLVRGDSYYIFDFSNAPIGKSIRKSQLDTIGPLTTNARIEVIHAFLACLRTADNKRKKQFNPFPMDFMDHYIIVPSNNFELESQLKDANCFSTNEYMHLCKFKLENLNNSLPNSPIDETDIFEEALMMLDLVLANQDPKVIFILAYLYRAAVYHKLSLEIQSTSALKTIFQQLAEKNKNTSTSKKSNIYEKLQEDYAANPKEVESLKNLKNYREMGTHDLIFPESKHGTTSHIQNSYRFLERVFNQMLATKIDIPISQIFYNILE